jgi:hypothetical protein
MGIFKRFIWKLPLLEFCNCDLHIQYMFI